MTLSGQSPVLTVGAAKADGAADLHVSGDEEGVVRLYRRQDEEQQQQGGGKGKGGE